MRWFVLYARECGQEGKEARVWAAVNLGFFVVQFESYLP